jgi:chaperonin cofactor prefoldin
MNPDESFSPEPMPEQPRPDRTFESIGGNMSDPQRSSIDPSVAASGSASDSVSALEQRIAELRQQERALRQEISALQASYTTMLQKQIAESQAAIGQVVQVGLADLEQRRQTLQLAVEQLERRQERIRNEMRTTFAGSSQDLAIRVQGFKDYLVGSLQDLAAAAEQLQLVPPVVEMPRAAAKTPEPMPEGEADDNGAPRFAEQRFQDQTQRIRRLLDQYRSSPDYYGTPWQLRRTFEPIHADRVSDWFFAQGGRGALRTMGSRLQNILIASAVISILRDLYDDRLRALVLGNSPERLGEWRRGLQDCLGISRADFGSEEGIVLFEDPEPLSQRADRLLKQKQLPLIIVDETEEVIDIALLQFPLWLAFAPDPLNPMVY